MKKSHRILAGISLGACAALLAAVPGWTQGNSGTVARYTIDAGTSSGMAAMTAGGGGGGVGAALGALGGGGNQVAHELYLRLGSTRAPTGEAQGDHFMPSGARLGQSVPLETPRSVAAPQGTPGEIPQGQMPQGRLLLAGDAAHIVPPTGAKGLNLAASDVHYAAEALTAFFNRNDGDAIAGYAAKALARVWKAERFSWSLTRLMHRFPEDGPFERAMQVAELDYIASSRAAQTSIAENYVGLPV